MWPAPSEVERWLEAARRGEASAVERLMDRHRAPLAQIVRRRIDRKLAARVDASDIVQDVLLEAARRLPEFLKTADTSFGIWLRRLARDRLIDAYRRHRQARRRSTDCEQSLAAVLDRSSLELADRLRDPGSTPAAQAIRRELEQRFLDALTGLDELDRETIWLRHVEQLSNVEAARLLGLTPAAAGMRYLRALRRLRAVLGADARSGSACD
jgi:RNA polymerase sigma-70 factor (ECF subfamily)